MKTFLLLLLLTFVTGDEEAVDASSWSSNCTIDDLSWSGSGKPGSAGTLREKPTATFVEIPARCTSLDLGNQKLRDSAVAALTEALDSPHAPRVTTLRLQRNLIGDEGARYLANFLPTVGKLIMFAFLELCIQSV
jgi:hypothetical protein